jgi:tetratricopeptide (TPR) repeat protein/DNA-binding winged helix-turn-helix (wHTH) protein
MLSASRILIFGDFRFEVPTRQLLRGGTSGQGIPIVLGSRASDLLLLFLQRPGELVTKNDIMDAVWPNAAVEESNLTVQISALRRALDADRAGSSAIQTVPGRGYRFILSVTPETNEAALPVARPNVQHTQDEAVSKPADSSPPLLPVESGIEVSPQSNFDSASVARQGSGRTARWALFGAGTATVLAAVVAFIQLNSNKISTAPPIGSVTALPSPPRLSVAALPFVNVSGDASNDVLAATLTDDVATGLSEISGSFVVSRSMAQTAVARKLTLPEIGRELGIRYVLEGSLRRSPNGAEIKVQLSDAASGSSVWAGRFEGATREPGDFSTQIIQNLMFPLKMALMDAEALRLSKLPVGALTAQDLLVQARASANHEPETRVRNAENIAMLERALALEPMSAEIMIALADEILRPILDFYDPEVSWQELRQRVRALVDQARALVGGIEAIRNLQALILRLEGQSTEAIEAYTQLKEAHPTNITYHQGLALSLMSVGRSAEALPFLQDSISLDRGVYPKRSLYGNLGYALVRVGRNEEATKWLRAAKERTVGFDPQINLWLAIAYAHSGNLQSAQREFREASSKPAIYAPQTLRNLRHQRWGGNRALAEEMTRLTDGLAIAGMRDHVEEDFDPRLPITQGLRPTHLNAPTPLGAPGVALIRTPELNTLIGDQDGGTGDAAPLVISSVCSNCFDLAFPGAISLPTELQWAFSGSPADEGRRRALKSWVNGLLQGNDGRRLITMSWSANWWQARNLAIEIASLGYSNVSWYRGGLEAWDVAGLPTTRNSGQTIANYDDAIRRDPRSPAAFYGRGIAHRAAGKFDRAIADLSEAIRIDPKLARAYLNRGLAYAAKGDHDRALVDYDETIRLDAKIAVAYRYRGDAYQAKGQLELAMADYNKAISQAPKLTAAYFSRGRAQLHGGFPARAQADFGQASQLSPASLYYVLWLDIAEIRGGLPRHLQQAGGQLDMATWPGALVRMYRGELTPAQVLASAIADMDPEKRLSKVCEAHFFIGELELSQGAKDEAIRLFRIAAKDCPINYNTMRGSAIAELKELGATP